MTACKITCWAVPDPGFPSQSVAKGHCQTHGLGFIGMCTAGACPVGVIEQAVEDGVNRIIEAIKEGK